MPEAAGSEQLLVFKVAGQSLAMPARDVAEIIRPPTLTRVPHGPASLLGVINFRSTALPVVSLASLLGNENSPQTGAARVLVVDRGAPIGLLVDEISALTDSGHDRQLDLEGLLARDFSKLFRKTSAQRSSAIAPAISSAAERDRAAFVCFVVASQDYALPMDQVVEVTALPAELAQVPRTDEAMAGVTALRSGLVPLVWLRVLLGLPQEGFDREKARVVLVRFGGRLVGLITDGIKAILRVDRAALDPVPPVLTRGVGEAQIDAICRLDNGRLVSILAPDKLFDARTSARIAESTHGAAEMANGDAKTDSEQFIIFELGDEHYGLSITAVNEVVRRPDNLTRVPRAPPFVEGVMSLRGKMVPVIDQRQRFAVQGEVDNRSRRVIIVTVEGLQTGIVVDKVTEIFAIPANELKPAPDLEAETTTPVFDRIAMTERDGRIILLVDPKGLLNRAERDVIATLGSEPANAHSS